MTAATAEATRKEPAGVLKRTTAFFIDPNLLAIDPEWNIRWDMGDIEGLAASIKAQKERDPASGGLIQAIGVVRIPASHPLSQGGKKNFLVRWGHRRTTAIHMLMAKGEKFPEGIPAKITVGHDIQAATLEMFVENTNKPLLPMEEAAAYKRLRDGFPDADPPIKGMTLKELCKAVGRALPHVTAMLDLLNADEGLIAAVKDGTVKKMHAKDIAMFAKHDKKAQQELTEVAKRAAKGDKKAGVELAKGVHRVRLDAAAKAGRHLKMRALSDQELAELGGKVGARMADMLKNAGKPLDFDLRTWVSQDDKLALAASYGALQALKAAAGMSKDIDQKKITLEF